MRTLAEMYLRVLFKQWELVFICNFLIDLEPKEILIGSKINWKRGVSTIW